MTNAIRDALLACLLAFVFGPTHAGAQTRAGAATLDRAEVVAWREDLRHMAAEMAKRHKNLYHTVSRARFDSAVTSLDRRIPSLARHQVIVELARIVGLVGDGHTNVAPTRDPKIGFRTLPVRLYLFKDGLFVRAARRAQASLAGARVVQIGRASPEQAYAKVRELVGRDNEMDARFFAPFLLAMPEVLHALGIIDDMERVPMVIERGGHRSRVILSPSGLAPMMPPDTDLSWWPDSGWVDMRDSAPNPTPLWLRRDPAVHFRVEYIPERRLAYVQYNKVGDMEGESIADFSRRLLSLLDTAGLDRLVLDLRLNRGGNGTLNAPLLLSLIKARKLDGPGKLFAIIGRSTFSAAQFMVNDLERYTDAVFVGEPSGGKPNSYGDSRKITLPHSGITVRVSIYWWQEEPWDTRQWKAPDLAAELTSANYRANMDPALKAAVEYRAEPPIADRMGEALSSGSIPEAVRRYREYMADPRHAYADEEASLNTLGYRLLSDGRHEEAIAVLELNAAAHPESANVYDSLGEAYEKAGRPDAAARNYKKVLRLDPSNSDARNRLEQLLP
ncbi:MAG TPA: tetratricopeptide repeat protein [Gemmatimonadales bacterium]|jgi:tetratricopeptide (TPR) repeat protein